MPTGEGAQASRTIDEMIAAIPGWRGEMLGRLRALIRRADPEVPEEVKWRKPSNPSGVPTWSHDSIICTGEVYRDKVKLTFANGASLADPAKLFNASLDAKMRRAIDLHESELLDEVAFQCLIRDAADYNVLLCSCR